MAAAALPLPKLAPRRNAARHPPPRPEGRRTAQSSKDAQKAPDRWRQMEHSS